MGNGEGLQIRITRKEQGEQHQLWWFEGSWSPCLTLGPQLAAMFGKDQEVWQCWRKCVIGTRGQALRFQMVGAISTVHSASRLRCELPAVPATMTFFHYYGL